MAEESKKLLLIVEDEEIVARLYMAGLANTSFAVKIARDGVEALELMKAQIPEIVLIDIMMPKMNGIQLLTAMKADPKLKAVKAIMMTNLSSDEDKKQAMDLGADDYWVKRDIQPREIEKRVEEILGKGK